MSLIEVLKSIALFMSLIETLKSCGILIEFVNFCLKKELVFLDKNWRRNERRTTGYCLGFG
jgi:hypothetical protein